jgi:hypothetical protein
MVSASPAVRRRLHVGDGALVHGPPRDAVEHPEATAERGVAAEAEAPPAAGLRGGVDAPGLPVLRVLQGQVHHERLGRGGGGEGARGREQARTVPHREPTRTGPAGDGAGAAVGGGAAPGVLQMQAEGLVEQRAPLPLHGLQRDLVAAGQVHRRRLEREELERVRPAGVGRGRREGEHRSEKGGPHRSTSYPARAHPPIPAGAAGGTIAGCVPSSP